MDIPSISWAPRPFSERLSIYESDPELVPALFEVSRSRRARRGRLQGVAPQSTILVSDAWEVVEPATGCGRNKKLLKSHTARL